MNIGEYSVHSKVISWLLVVIMVGGGLLAYENMGKLEDPAFTIKSAKILTAYPGATAQEVQDEVTYHLEDAIQRMEQVTHMSMADALANDTEPDPIPTTYLGLKTLLKSFKVEDTSVLVGMLDDWYHNEEAKILKRPRASKMALQNLNDKVRCIHVF